MLVKLKYLLKEVERGFQASQNLLVEKDSLSTGRSYLSWFNIGDLTNSYLFESQKYLLKDNIPLTKIYPPNSLLIAVDGATIGKLGISTTPFVMNSHCCVLSCNKSLEMKYLYYYLLLLNDFDYFSKISHGSIFQGITIETLKSIKIPFCSLSNQQETISSLDQHCSLIHQLLSKIDLLLKKLGEYQEALLYDTLVHQKAPTTIIKLKYLSTLKGRIGWQALTTQEYQQQGAYLVTGVNIQQGVIDWSSCHHVSIERYEMDPNIQLQEQDLIITKDGTIGKVALIQHLPSIATLNSGLMLIRKKSSVFYSEKYLYYLLSSFYFHDWYRLTLKPNSTILHLYQKDFLNFPVLLSPLNVQQELCTFLDHKMTLLIKLQSHYQSLKVHLGEYQQSLLYETFQNLL